MSQAAAAAQLPTEIELRAAYCIRVIQKENESLVRPDESSNALGKEVYDYLRLSNADKLNRLQSYLLPRIQYLDVIALRGATSRAERDHQTFKESEVRIAEAMANCLHQCLSKGDPLKSERVECNSACKKSSELVSRLSVCDKLEWLPF